MLKKFVFITILVLILLFFVLPLYLLALRSDMIVIRGIFVALVMWLTIVFIMLYLMM